MRLLSFEPDRVLTVLIPTTSMLKYKGEERAWQVFSAKFEGLKDLNWIFALHFVHAKMILRVWEEGLA